MEKDGTRELEINSILEEPIITLFKIWMQNN